jgi:tetratricopeptide (TPR) repeat protein
LTIQKQNRFLLAALLMATSFLCAQTSSPKKPSSPTSKEKIVVEDDDASSTIDPRIPKAEAAIAAKDYENAEAMLLAVAEKYPKEYRTWFDLSYVYIGTGKRDKAIDSLKRCIAIKPDLLEAYLNLGTLIAVGGATAEAAPYLKQATQLKPVDPNSDVVFRSWLLYGRAIIDTDPKTAILAGRKAAELNSQSPEPHLVIADASGLLRDIATQETELKAAQLLDPKSSEALAGLVFVYTSTHRNEDAMKALQSFIILEPKNAQAHRQLARLEFTVGKKEEALIEMDQARLLAPDDKEILQDASTLYLEMKKYEEARILLERLVKSSPNNAVFHADLGHALTSLRQYEDAEKELITSLRINEKQAGALEDLGFVAGENKHYQLALKALEARSQIVADTPFTYFLRAINSDNLQMFKEAAIYYHKFLDAAGDKMPTQKWQAEHRLLAIEPKKK